MRNRNYFANAALFSGLTACSLAPNAAVQETLLYGPGGNTDEYSAAVQNSLVGEYKLQSDRIAAVKAFEDGILSFSWRKNTITDDPTPAADTILPGNGTLSYRGTAVVVDSSIPLGVDGDAVLNNYFSVVADTDLMADLDAQAIGGTIGNMIRGDGTAAAGTIMLDSGNIVSTAAGFSFDGTLSGDIEGSPITGVHGGTVTGANGEYAQGFLQGSTAGSMSFWGNFATLGD